MTMIMFIVFGIVLGGILGYMLSTMITAKRNIQDIHNAICPDARITRSPVSDSKQKPPA